MEMPAHWVLVGFDRVRFPIESALAASAPRRPLRFRLRSDSALAREAMVEAGGGVAMYFTDIAAMRPGLVRLWPRQVALRQEVWLCAHDELRRSTRMRCVWDCLGDALQARFARPS
jgi:DNA-binding transcriptional LysR family regulator